MSEEAHSSAQARDRGGFVSAPKLHRPAVCDQPVGQGDRCEGRRFKLIREPDQDPVFQKREQRQALARWKPQESEADAATTSKRAEITDADLERLGIAIPVHGVVTRTT